MAATRWTFPDGASGDPLTPALAGADTATLTGGTAVLSDAQTLIGPQSLRMVGTQSGHLWFAKEGLSATAYAVDCYLYIDQAPSADVFLLWTGSSSSMRAATVRLDLDRCLELTDNATTTRWASSPLPLNEWVRVSMYVTCSPTEGTALLQWYLGHDPLPQETSGTVTSLNTGEAIDRIRIGAKAAISSATMDLYFSSWAYDPEATGLIPQYEVPPWDPQSIPGVAAIKAGTTNVDRVMRGSQILWPATHAAVSMTVAGTDFAPQIELRLGAEGTVEWFTDAENAGTPLEPVFEWADSGPHQVTMVASNRLDIQMINLGFDNSQDQGRYQVGAQYNRPAQPVTHVRGLRGLSNLKYFMGANGPLTGLLDFTGCRNLEHIECFEAQVQEVTLTGCTKMVRICLESTQLQYLDLGSVQDSLYDLRAANMQGGVLEFSSVTNMPKLYHFCVRTQSLVNAPTLDKLPVVEQWWVWGNGLVDPGSPVSPLMNSPLAHDNAFSQAAVDSILVHVEQNVSSGFGNVRLDGGTSAAPSAIGLAAAEVLRSRPNWTVTHN